MMDPEEGSSDWMMQLQLLIKGGLKLQHSFLFEEDLKIYMCARHFNCALSPPTESVTRLMHLFFLYQRNVSDCLTKGGLTN